MSESCSISGCSAEVMARTYCKRHYARWWQSGSVELEPPPASAREIPNLPGYFVTPAGDVYTTWHRQWRRSALLLKSETGRDRYPRVRIRGRRFLVHKLVLLTFVGPCPEGMESRHLDGDRGNPHLSNLRYGTKVENAADRVRHGTQVRGERSPAARWTDEQVASAVASYLAGEGTQREIAERIGAKQQHVSRWVAARHLPTRYAPRPHGGHPTEVRGTA